MEFPNPTPVSRRCFIGGCVAAATTITTATASADAQPCGKLPPGISMANVEFLRRNSGTIERLANETEVAGCDDGKGGGA